MLDARNLILAFYSHFNKNIDTMKEDLHNYFVNLLNISFPPKEDFKKHSDKMCAFDNILKSDFISLN